MGFKSIFCIGVLLLNASSSHAQEKPIVGLWEKIPVSDGIGTLIERTSYIFTKVELSKPTIFSGLRDSGGGMDVLCCVEVSNLKPLQLDAVLSKYKVDADFGRKLKSIKGLPFMYEAVPVAKSKRNESFQTVTNTDSDPNDTSPYSAAVISLGLGKATLLKSPFRSGENDISFSVKYPQGKNSVVYNFKINNQDTVFSENTEPH